MIYDFDKYVERRNTNSVKWDSGNKDTIPMWVADMDFLVAEPIIDAIKKKAEHGIYGYGISGEDYYAEIKEWMGKKHDFKVEREWIKFSPGVVPAINMLIRAYAKPGDGVILQSPVYYPFYQAIKNNGCRVIENPLVLKEDTYTMDLIDLENKIKSEKAKILILCSPHNPVGRVWTKEELTALGNICVSNGVLVIADEIHNDIIYKEFKHTTFASISKDFSDICATCIAPSKTFNLAGLQTSSVIISKEELRAKFEKILESNGVWEPNIFGVEASIAAYKYGEEWLEQLIDYLKGNLDYLTSFIEDKIPSVKVIKPQGTYLVWLDCRKIGMGPEELHKFFLKKGKVWFDEGYIFGKSGEGFERVNIACARSTLKEAMERMERAINFYR